ncbi:LPS assembly lipoprotein LptE [Alteromonas sp. ASW11-19]|uniref:LPS-assembly lipoprotein LptE n=1 Tax=Alteromonas salexigens TaxID=2982530 RepID=A0ABT2VLY2_9ALTE|nr:LPS assembly lipoprotein LptE [Alteromonas salexigens]MCU7554330.1 LPS assembly lipoprotein LptE [Alteromonas salexigens]
MLKFGLTALLSLMIAGCGFQLRGGQTLPPDINQVAVDAVRVHSPLARTLLARLDVYDIQRLRASKVTNADHTVLVRILPESLERRLLSVYPSGQVAEYELIYGVKYVVQFPGAEAVTASFEVLRDYQDDPDQVLAKSRELDLVLKEMREEAADRIIRRLASQAPHRATVVE